MAILHLETKPISRSSGRSSTASSAYRAGVAIEDKRTGLTYDFERKKGIADKDCFMFHNGEKVTLDRGKLWNTVEQTEKRKDARTAREFIINLPHELEPEQRKELTAKFSEHLAKKFGVAIDYAIHDPNPKGDDRNFHAHIMVTTRTAKLDPKGKLAFGDKTALELSNKKLKQLNLPTTFEQIKELRKEWAEHCNEHLHQAGHNIKLDHRSFKEQGLDKLPTVKLGWWQSKLEREGVATKGGDYNRYVKEHNAQLTQCHFDIGRLTAQQKFEQMKAEKERQTQETLQNVQKQPLELTSKYEAWKLAQEGKQGLERTTTQNSPTLSLQDKFAQWKADQAKQAEPTKEPETPKAEPPSYSPRGFSR